MHIRPSRKTHPQSYYFYQPSQPTPRELLHWLMAAHSVHPEFTTNSFQNHKQRPRWFQSWFSCRVFYYIINIAVARKLSSTNLIKTLINYLPIQIRRRRPLLLLPGRLHKYVHIRLSTLSSLYINAWMQSSLKESFPVSRITRTIKWACLKGMRNNSTNWFGCLSRSVDSSRYLLVAKMKSIFTWEMFFVAAWRTSDGGVARSSLIGRLNSSESWWCRTVVSGLSCCASFCCQWLCFPHIKNTLAWTTNDSRSRECRMHRSLVLVCQFVNEQWRRRRLRGRTRGTGDYASSSWRHGKVTKEFENSHKPI